MIITAIFVEGQTELVFVREFLLKWFEYSDIAIECYTLFSDKAHSMHPTEYAFPNDQANHYFQIVNVGGDGNVLTRMLSREQMLRNAGFDLVVGLRDMFSEDYRKLSKSQGIVSEISQRFIGEANKQIQKRAQMPDRTQLKWAIMETEAWMLGLHACFERLDERLSVGHIAGELGFDLSQCDPENRFFHPARELKQIYELAGLQYDKTKGDINSIMGHLQRSDFKELKSGDTCASFSSFVDSLEIPV